MLQSLPHLVANLLWSFQVVVKLLLINTILGSQQGGKSGLPLFQVSLLLYPHLLDSFLHQIFLDQFVSLGLPVCLMGKIIMSLDIFELALQFLRSR